MPSSAGRTRCSEVLANRLSGSPARSVLFEAPRTTNEAPAGCPVAVEVGFEPTEDLRLHTLSRRAPSATRRLHRARAYLSGGPGGSARQDGQRRCSKNSRSSAAALTGQHPADDLDLRPEAPAVAHHIPQRARGSRAVVRGPVDQPAHPRGRDRPGAHRAGLEGNDQRAASQPPVAQRPGRRADRHDLGMGRGVPVRLPAVAPRGRSPSRSRVEHHRSHRHISTSHAENQGPAPRRMHLRQGQGASLKPNAAS